MSQGSEEVRRELVGANLMLLALMLLCAVGYRVIEGWNWLEGFYMTFITLTTIGFGEVRDMSDLGRVFTIFLGLGGIGTVAFIATRSAQILINSNALRKRHQEKMIERTKDHYILCGYGRIGSRIAADLKSRGVPFVIIENAPKKLEQIVADDHLYVEGDAELESTLERAGISRAKGLVLTLPEDRANVFVTLVARELSQDIFILARTDKNQNKRKLIRAGANTVVSPYEIGADRMAEVILQPSLGKFMQRVRHTEAINLEEIKIDSDSALAGATVAASQFRERFDAIIVAIIDSETDEMTFNPKGSVKLTPGDSLVILGSKEMVQRVRQEGCTSAVTA
ncbi:MAG: potassium channel protein [Rhodothermales bacterium]|nr:potassium channel protein [Rhodothermales bacterium]